MWRKVAILLVVIAMCHCNPPTHNFPIRKKYHHHHYKNHLFYGGALYYMTFLLIKLKIVFVLGAVFTFALFFGKLYALVKYMDYSTKHDKNEHHHHGPEKIYLQSPSHNIPYGGFGSGGITYGSPSPQDSYVPSSFGNGGGFAVDKLPPNAEVYGGGGYGQYYDSPPPNHGYGRSIVDNFTMFMNFVKKLDLTESAFKSMKIISNDCKRKFVCRSDFSARFSQILSKSIEFLRDDSYDRYKTNQPIESLQECDKLYPKCHDEM